MRKRDELVEEKNFLNEIVDKVEENSKSVNKVLNENFFSFFENLEKRNFLEEIENKNIKILTKLEEEKEKIKEALNYFLNKKEFEYLKEISKNLEQIEEIELLKFDIDFFKNLFKDPKLLMNSKNDLSSITLKTFNYSIENFIKTENISYSLKNFDYLDNLIIFIADSKTKEIFSFDLEKNKFNKLNIYFNDLEFKDHSNLKYFKDNLFILTGGVLYSNFRNTASNQANLVKIDENLNVFIIPIAPMNSVRFSHGCSVINGICYVYGGYNGQKPISCTEYYDEDSNCWIKLENMNQERELFAHTSIANRFIFVFGGFHESSNHLDSIERYDVLQNKWKLLNVTMKKPLQNATACPINERKIVLIGGFNQILFPSVEIFDIWNEEWTSLCQMSIPRRKAHCFYLGKMKNNIIQNSDGTENNDDERFGEIIIIGGEANDSELHFPERLNLNEKTSKFVEIKDILESKNLNYWSSSKKML